MYECIIDSSVINTFNRSSIYDRINTISFADRHTLLGAIPLKIDSITREIEIKCKKIFLNLIISPNKLVVHDHHIKLLTNAIIDNTNITKLVLSIPYRWQDYINSFPNVKELKIITHSSEYEPYGEQFLVKHMGKHNRNEFNRHVGSPTSIELLHRERRSLLYYVTGNLTSFCKNKKITLDMEDINFNA